jgi:hypothetical protein
MKNSNLLIRHKHSKEIYVIERFVVSDYERKVSHICRYTWALDLTWMKNNYF